MAGSGVIFPVPTDEQRRALVVARAYLARAANQAGSTLLLWRPGHRDVDLVREFRRQLEQSAAVCATLLEVFDGWPGED